MEKKTTKRSTQEWRRRRHPHVSPSFEIQWRPFWEWHRILINSHWQGLAFFPYLFHFSLVLAAKEAKQSRFVERVARSFNCMEGNGSFDDLAWMFIDISVGCCRLLVVSLWRELRAHMATINTSPRRCRDWFDFGFQSKCGLWQMVG